MQGKDKDREFSCKTPRILHPDIISGPTVPSRKVSSFQVPGSLYSACASTVGVCRLGNLLRLLPSFLTNRNTCPGPGCRQSPEESTWDMVQWAGTASCRVQGEGLLVQGQACQSQLGQVRHVPRLDLGSSLSKQGQPARGSFFSGPTPPKETFSIKITWGMPKLLLL